jgi:hypothetical protein
MTKIMPKQKPGRSEQVVEAPADFLASVKTRFGLRSFDWDLAAGRTNQKAPNYFGPDSPSGEDSLPEPWPIGDCWLNPPYGDIAPWAQKCSESAFPWCRRRIYFLVPASVGSNWFADHVFGEALVLFLRPLLVFVGRKQSYPKDLILAVYGGVPGVECWRWKS